MKNFYKLFALRESDKRYYVNEEKGTVTCILKHHYALRSYTNERDCVVLNAMFSLMRANGSETSAVAHLAPGDTWDEIKGKQIAYMKAKKAAFKDMMNFLSECGDLFQMYSDGLIGEAGRYCKAIEIENKELNIKTK